MATLSFTHRSNASPLLRVGIPLSLYELRRDSLQQLKTIHVQTNAISAATSTKIAINQNQNAEELIIAEQIARDTYDYCASGSGEDFDSFIADGGTYIVTGNGISPNQVIFNKEVNILQSSFESSGQSVNFIIESGSSLALGNYSYAYVTPIGPKYNYPGDNTDIQIHALPPKQTWDTEALFSLLPEAAQEGISLRDPHNFIDQIYLDKEDPTKTKISIYDVNGVLLASGYPNSFGYYNPHFREAVWRETLKFSSNQKGLPSYDNGVCNETPWIAGLPNYYVTECLQCVPSTYSTLLACGMFGTPFQGTDGDDLLCWYQFVEDEDISFDIIPTHLRIAADSPSGPNHPNCILRYLTIASSEETGLNVAFMKRYGTLDPIDGTFNDRQVFDFPDTIKINYTVLPGFEDLIGDYYDCTNPHHWVSIEIYNEVGEAIGASLPGEHYVSGTPIELAYPTYTFGKDPEYIKMYDIGAIYMECRGLDKIIGIDILSSTSESGEADTIVICGDGPYVHKLIIGTAGERMSCVHAQLVPNIHVTVHLDINETEVL